jgi:hypothetical protein
MAQSQKALLSLRPNSKLENSNLERILSSFGGCTMTLEISQKTQHLLQVEAERQHTSPEQLAELLIKRGLLVKKRDLSHLAGTWSEEEYRQFEELVAPLQEVVEE